MVPESFGRLIQEHRRRFFRFALVGGSGVLVNMGVLILLVSKARWSPVMAAPIAIEFAVVNNFLLNDRWTFGDKRGGRSLFQRFVRYNALTLGGVLISALTLAALVTFSRMHYVVANLFAIGVGTLWNYSTNSLLTWASSSASELPRARASG